MGVILKTLIGEVFLLLLALFILSRELLREAHHSFRAMFYVRRDIIMWTWLVLCANKKRERDVWFFWDSKFNLPIPLLWSKESKESEKTNCFVFTFCKSLHHPRALPYT
jgi:hypothetical protein